MGFFGISNIVKGVEGIIDNLHTSDKEKLTLQLEGAKIDAGLMQGQMAINLEEAKSKSIFFAGGRPAVIWICVIALGYNFLLYPLLQWIWTILTALKYLPPGITLPPVLSMAQLMPILLSLLGIGAYRSYDKAKGTQTNSLK